MSDDVGDKLSGTSKRLLIAVPSPLGRINLGAPWQDYAPKGSFETDGVAKFGYTGVSIQSGAHLFIDANKFTLFQTGISFMGQVGGQWLQYSNSHQFIASRANGTFAVDNKLLLAAGAGHGQITSLDHGQVPRMVPYNNLNLHYRVEEVQNGLSEFFTGRREREKPWPGRFIALFKYQKGGEYNRTKGVLTEQEGFWDVLDRATDYLGIGLPSYRGAQAVFPRSAGAKYGYSGYFSRFDPYAKKEPQGKKYPFIWFRNVLVDLRRFADVIAKLGEAITNLPLIRQAFGLMDSVESFLLGLDASLRAAGTLGAGPKAGEGVPFDKQVLDELDSALLARIAGADAQYGSRKAKLTTGDGPFTVAGGGYVELRTSPSGAWTKSRIVPGQAPELVGSSGLGTVPSSVRSSTITLAPRATSRTTTVSTAAADVSALVTALNQATATDVLMSTGAQLFGTLDADDGKHLKVDTVPPLTTQLVIRSTAASTLLGLGLIDATAAASGTASVSLAVPFVAPGAIDLTLLAAGSVVVELVRESRSATISWDANVTASAGAIVTAINREATEAALVPSTVRLADTSGTSLRLTPPNDTAVSFASTGDAATRLGLSDTSSQTSAVVGSGPLTEGWGANPWIVIKTDAGEARLVLNASNAATVSSLASAINAAIGGTVASASGSALKLESQSRGSGAFVELRADSVRTFELLGFPPPEVPLLRQEGEDVTLTGAQLKELMEQGPFGTGSSTITQVTIKHHSSGGDTPADRVEVESTETLSGDTTSYLEVRGPLASVFGGTKDEVTAPDDGPEDSIKNFHAVWFELNKLPEDTRNILRPINHFMNDVVDSIAKAEEAAEKATGALLGSRFIPDGPPNAMGLIAKDGITLGTPEKIVGAAGKGYLLVADGGTGQRDVKKFVQKLFLGLPMERLISNFMSNTCEGIGDLLWPPKPEEPPDKEDYAAGGFHVISNSTASMIARSSIDLLAVGNSKKDANTNEGFGVARIAATRSVEVAGHQTVRIAATGYSSKAAAPINELTPDKKGGVVEVLGSRLVLGATRGAGPLTSEKHEIDWPLNKSKTMTMEIRERDMAAPTETIELGARESTTVQVAPYTLTMKTDGVYLGGPSATSQQALQEHTQLINDQYDAADDPLTQQLEVEMTGFLLAKANAARCALTETGLVEGIDGNAWRSISTDHKVRLSGLSKALKASVANRAKDLGAFKAMKYSPALVFAEDEIVLGFKVDTGAAMKWGPRVHIKPDQLLVAMGATATGDDSQQSMLLLKAKQLEYTPTQGQVKLKIAAQGAKMQAGAQSYVEWTAAATSGANVKKI